MKIVIEISEDKYKRIVEKYDTFPVEMKEWGLNAIKNGTPLPKEHGRLIDADKLHHCECKGNFSECDTCLDDDLCNLVNDAPTIIKADKKSER